MTLEKHPYKNTDYKKPKTRKVGRSEYLTDRDFQILKYLGRWKISSASRA